MSVCSAPDNYIGNSSGSSGSRATNINTCSSLAGQDSLKKLVLSKSRSKFYSCSRSKNKNNSSSSNESSSSSSSRSNNTTAAATTTTAEAAADGAVAVDAVAAATQTAAAHRSSAFSFHFLVAIRPCWAKDVNIGSTNRNRGTCKKRKTNLTEPNWAEHIPYSKIHIDQRIKTAKNKNKNKLKNKSTIRASVRVFFFFAPLLAKINTTILVSSGVRLRFLFPSAAVHNNILHMYVLSGIQGAMYWVKFDAALSWKVIRERETRNSKEFNTTVTETRVTLSMETPAHMFEKPLQDTW